MAFKLFLHLLTFLHAGLADWTVSISPAKVNQGGICEIRMVGTSREIASLPVTLKWKNLEFTSFKNPSRSDEWLAFLAIPHDAPPGKEELILKDNSPSSPLERAVSFEVTAGQFKSEMLEVDSARVKLSNKNKERTQQEWKEVRALYTSPETAIYWEKNFQKPLSSLIKSEYGTRRLFNGEQKNHHSGVDFRAASGTPIKAANRGKVRLAKNLFMAGNMIVIDHGGGIFTNYAHLSRINVKVGQVVQLGDTIGLAGSTGRVSGPHLHWGVRIHGEEADPLELLKLKLE